MTSTLTPARLRLVAMEMGERSLRAELEALAGAWEREQEVAETLRQQQRRAWNEDSRHLRSALAVATRSVRDTWDRPESK